MRYFNLRISILFLFLFVLKADLYAYEYEVKGTTSYRFIDRKKNITVVDQEQDFAISVSGNRWFLRETPVLFTQLGNRRPLPDYIEASSDLTNYYFLVSYATLAKQHPGALNTCAGTIGKGIFPYGQDPTISLLWYAFASGWYLREQTSGFIYGVTPFRNPGYYSKDFRTSASWRLESFPPNLPEAIAFFGEYKFLQESPDPSFPEPLNATNCIYTALAFTNIGDMALPLQGEARFPTTNFVVTDFEFKVLSVARRSTVENFTIHIPGTAILSDLRPIAVDLPVAVPTGLVHGWPRLDASEDAYARLVQGKKLVQTRSRGNGIARMCIVTLFVVITGLFITTLIVHKKASIGSGKNGRIH
jgi:hypothetical protein